MEKRMTAEELLGQLRNCHVEYESPQSTTGAEYRPRILWARYLLSSFEALCIIKADRKATLEAAAERAVEMHLREGIYGPDALRAAILRDEED